MKLIKWLKNDYMNVHMALEMVVKRRIPKWISLIYYVIAGIIVLPFTPFILGWYWYIIAKVKRDIKKWSDDIGNIED